MVSYLPIWRAISVFVPTPSVDVASNGCFISFNFEASKRPANPPMPPITSGLPARATAAFINSTARSPASISTPASLYVDTMDAPLQNEHQLFLGEFFLLTYLLE